MPSSFSHLDYYIQQHFQKYLERDISEIAINKPGQLFLREGPSWVCYFDESLTMKKLTEFANLVATSHKQEISEKHPLLSATLADGLRIQVVLPPAVPANMFGMCIRKPQSKTLTWDIYREQGFFSHTMEESSELTTTEKELLTLKKNRAYEDFLKLAVLSKQNIVVSGSTGSGKTTFTNLLIDEIPRHERIATIEDAIELNLPHENVLRLIYSKGGQGLANITPDNLIEACLRLTPSRIILAEIRGAETFAFINAISSGHDGCITSLHARDPEVAFQRMSMMFKMSETGKNFDLQSVLALLYSQINVIVQITYDEINNKRFISSLYYDPSRQKQSLYNPKVQEMLENSVVPSTIQ